MVFAILSWVLELQESYAREIKQDLDIIARDFNDLCSNHLYSPMTNCRIDTLIRFSGPVVVIFALKNIHGFGDLACGLVVHA